MRLRFAPITHKSNRGGFILSFLGAETQSFACVYRCFLHRQKTPAGSKAPPRWRVGAKHRLSSAFGGGPPKLSSPSGGGRVGAWEG